MLAWAQRAEAPKACVCYLLAFRPRASCLTSWCQPRWFPVRKTRLKVAFTKWGICCLMKLGSPKRACFRHSRIQGLQQCHHDSVSLARLSASPSLDLSQAGSPPEVTRMAPAIPGSHPASSATLMERGLLFPGGPSRSPGLECHWSS